jgi:hypothetical protein
MTINDLVQHADEILRNFNLKKSDFESIDFELFEFVSSVEDFEETDFDLVKEGILAAEPIDWYGESIEFVGTCSSQEKAAKLVEKAQKAFDKRYKGTIPEYDFFIYSDDKELRFYPRLNPAFY